jgi:hypothetical protein
MKKPYQPQLKSSRFTEEELEQWADEFQVYEWSLISQYQKLSERFMIKFKHRLDWDYIAQYQDYSLDFAIEMELYKKVAYVGENNKTKKMMYDLMLIKNKEVDDSKVDDLLVYLRLIENNKVTKEDLLNAKSFYYGVDETNEHYVDVMLLDDSKIEIVTTYDEELAELIADRLREDLLICMY